MVNVVEENNLSDADVADLTGVFMSAFEHDPIGFMFHGVQMKDDPELWRIHCKEDIIAGLQSGRVVVSRSEAGEIVAGAVCYGPGQNTPEKAATEDWQNRLDSMPPQQAAFLAKYHELQQAHYDKLFPANFARDNTFVWQLAVSPTHHRKGLGRQLMKYIVDLTSPEQRVVLDTSKWENASLRMLRKHIAHGSIGHCIVQVLFYQACGFELKGSFEVEHYELGPLPRMYTLVRQGGKAE